MRKLIYLFIKRNLTFLVLLFFTISCKSQNSIPLKNPIDLEYGSGRYFKDIDNVFGPYIGTWETSWNNKKLTLKFEKITKHLHTYPNDDFYYNDVLVGKYKIVDLVSGQVIEDNMNTINFDLIKITSMGSGKDKILSFIFTDDDLCSITGILRIGYVLDNPNILNYRYEFDDFYKIENCPYSFEDIPISIPTIDLVLTRLP